MNWTEVSTIIAIAALVGGVIGWILPSPIQMQNRISAIEKDLAVLVNTVTTLRDTVTDLVRYFRGTDNGNNNASGRRTRV